MVVAVSAIHTTLLLANANPYGEYDEANTPIAAELAEVGRLENPSRPSEGSAPSLQSVYSNDTTPAPVRPKLPLHLPLKPAHSFGLAGEHTNVGVAPAPIPLKTIPDPELVQFEEYACTPHHKPVPLDTTIRSACGATASGTAVATPATAVSVETNEEYLTTAATFMPVLSVSGVPAGMG